MLSCYNILSKNGRLRKSVMSFLDDANTRVRKLNTCSDVS